MIVRNLPLVTFIVGKMADESGSSPIDREDAIAYGTEGLIQAVDHYDADRGRHVRQLRHPAHSRLHPRCDPAQ